MPRAVTAAWLVLAFCLLAVVPRAGLAATDAERAQTVIHMLDYVGVDYPEFVQDGKVLDEAEYQEQKEFATESIVLLEQLPEQPERPQLLAKARELLARIDAKAPGAEVSALAAAVRADVVRIYKVAVAPRSTPDLARAATLFQAQCAACHGAQGRGDGPLAKGMDPAPSNFHDAARMSQRSVYGLYNTISLGVAGTPMRGFNELSEADRWALAFFTADLRTPPELAARGEAAWKEGKGRNAFRDLQALVMRSPGEIATAGAELGPLHAYLVRHPQALAAAGEPPLQQTRARLADAVQAVRAGDRDAARQHAITAYLEGFELVEAALDNVDAALRRDIEREMIALRSAITDGAPADDVQARVARIEGMLDRADAALGNDGLSPATAFLSSLLILLREGLEAILVLAAIGAFVVKTGRRDALPYVHAGWIAAVLLGVVTWFVATHLVAVSGANRELTEGVTALLAAAMLLYVGWWLHGKSYAQAWNAFIRQQVTSALGRRTLWAMAGVSFLAVYRELFEIVLFYQTLWVQAGDGGRDAVLWGIAAAAVLLALIGGAILKFSVRLPIGPFFGVTSALLALLAIVFVGNGIAALQEAGVLRATLVDFVEWPLLGVHPTLQGLAWQGAALLLVAAGWLLHQRRNKVPEPAR
jgi:high-affinity iron transporter